MNYQKIFEVMKTKTLKKKKNEKFMLYFNQKSSNHYESDYENMIFLILSCLMFLCHCFQIFHNEYLMLTMNFHMQIRCKFSANQNVDITIYRYIDMRLSKHETTIIRIFIIFFQQIDFNFYD